MRVEYSHASGFFPRILYSSYASLTPIFYVIFLQTSQFFWNCAYPRRSAGSWTRISLQWDLSYGVGCCSTVSRSLISSVLARHVKLVLELKITYLLRAILQTTGRTAVAPRMFAVGEQHARKPESIEKIASSLRHSQLGFPHRAGQHRPWRTPFISAVCLRLGYME